MRTCVGDRPIRDLIGMMRSVDGAIGRAAGGAGGAGGGGCRLLGFALRCCLVIMGVVSVADPIVTLPTCRVAVQVCSRSTRFRKPRGHLLSGSTRARLFPW